MIILAIISLFSFLRYEYAQAPQAGNGAKFAELRIKEQTFKVEIADTMKKKEKGLSGRASLPQDQGMLFVFSEPGNYYFWMKDMNFPLDFIWINGNEIVDISKNIKPEEYQLPKSLTSKKPADKVLEINAGIAEKLQINITNKIDLGK